MKKTIFTLIITALIFSSCQQTTTKKATDPNQEFDVVILNGRVMDPEPISMAYEMWVLKMAKSPSLPKKKLKDKRPSMLRA